MALNPRQERFAHCFAVLGLAQGEAARRAGYSAKSADRFAMELLKKPLVASRIDTLRTQQQAKLEKVTEGKLLSRAAILVLLSDMAKHGHSDMAKLKAIELLSKLQGYNEPETKQHQHIHMHVDAGLINQLRSGYAALADREAPKQQAEGAMPVGGDQQDGYPHYIKGIPPTPAPEGESENIHTTEKQIPAKEFANSGPPIPRISSYPEQGADFPYTRH